MIKLNEEYFEKPYYFFLKDKGNKIAVYYSVSETLNESRKEDDFIEVDKQIFNDIQDIISKILKSGKKLTRSQVHKLIDSKTKTEILASLLEEGVTFDMYTSFANAERDEVEDSEEEIEEMYPQTITWALKLKK